MTAYLIARVEVTDPVQYEGYKKLTPAAVEAAGGKFIVRGGEPETLEGEPETRRVVVIEFDTTDAAKAFYDSALYVEARQVRDGAADMQMVVLPGV
ncbi:MAG: DUF1330 domain-containing protein [Actinomycetota bacterium]|nr:DUF1330 domain-containing protein [Actinomycetota bacterium]